MLRRLVRLLIVFSTGFSTANSSLVAGGVSNHERRADRRLADLGVAAQPTPGVAMIDDS